MPIAKAGIAEEAEKWNDGFQGEAEIELPPLDDGRLLSLRRIRSLMDKY